MMLALSTMPDLPEETAWRISAKFGSGNLLRGLRGEALVPPPVFEPRVKVYRRRRSEPEPVPPPPFYEGGNPFLHTYRLSRAVAESVASDFELHAEQILGRSRHRDVVDARSVVFNLLAMRGVAYTEIGRRFGRDHSTICHAIKWFDMHKRRNPMVAVSWERHAALAAEADAELARNAAAA